MLPWSVRIKFGRRASSISKPYIHAQSSAKKFGGIPEDYMAIHELLDSSKSAVATNVHRALTHNSWFISVIIPKIFGETFKRESDGKVVSSRDVAEQHVAEDFANKFIPSAQDYLQYIDFQDWMQNGQGEPPSFSKIVKSKKKVRPVTDEEVEEFKNRFVPAVEKPFIPAFPPRDYPTKPRPSDWPRNVMVD